MEPMEEVPLVGLGESELDRLVYGAWLTDLMLNTRWAKIVRPQTRCHNSVISQPIYNYFSLEDSLVNLHSTGY